MAPHDTRAREEARRRAVPLAAMGVCLAIALFGFLWWLSIVLQAQEGESTLPTEAPPSLTKPVN